MRNFTLNTLFLTFKMLYQVLLMPFIICRRHFDLFLRGLGLLGIDFVYVVVYIEYGTVPSVSS